MPNTTTTLIFIFALGACIGSFLNVVVWRLPRVQLPEKGGPLSDFFTSFKALSDPPSHCPNCDQLLKWYDNIPIFGWLKLRGRCRFCNCRISIRYPIVELVTALIFVGYFLAFYHYQIRTCCPVPTVIGMTTDSMGIAHEVTRSQWILHDSWPIYALCMAMLAGLLAASLIDAELYIIPLEIPWAMAIAAFVVHACADRPAIPGSLNLPTDSGAPAAAFAAGGTLGLLVSMLLWFMGWMPTSFPNGEPMLDVDRRHLQEEMERARKAGEEWKDGPLPPPYTAGQIRVEISKEMLFLLPPLLLAGAFVAVTTWMPSIGNRWSSVLIANNWLNALLGSLLGALVGAFVVWITRILGTLAFRKVAMGLGDVHLMFGVGAVIGAAGATIAFFIAPFFGIVYAGYMLVFRRGREIPLGPFLSLATAVVLLFYCPILDRLTPGFQGLGLMISELLHGTSP